MNLLRKLFYRDRSTRDRQPVDTPPDLGQLERRIGYVFRNQSLLTIALIHRSFTHSEGHHHTVSNERLEFLGDAVLNVFVSEFLYHTFPEKQEGELTKMKSLIVSRTVISEKASELHLGQHILLGPGEEQSGGRFRASILADAFEALLGAMYLDGGDKTVKTFLKANLLHDLDRLIHAEEHTNYKSLLLEHCQAQGRGQPVYAVTKERGPDHEKEFTVTVTIQGTVRGSGLGGTKREAEQQAAKEAFEKIEDMDT